MTTGSPLNFGPDPPGLTGALELVHRGVTPRIFEASAHIGGLAQAPAMLVGAHYVRYPLLGPEPLRQTGYRCGMRGLTSLMWTRLRPTCRSTTVPRKTSGSGASASSGAITPAQRRAVFRRERRPLVSQHRHRLSRERAAAEVADAGSAAEQSGQPTADRRPETGAVTQPAVRSGPEVLVSFALMTTPAIHA